MPIEQKFDLQTACLTDYDRSKLPPVVALWEADHYAEDVPTIQVGQFIRVAVVDTSTPIVHHFLYEYHGGRATEDGWKYSWKEYPNDILRTYDVMHQMIDRIQKQEKLPEKVEVLDAINRLQSRISFIKREHAKRKNDPLEIASYRGLILNLAAEAVAILTRI